jgi:hypothetical protein
MRKPVHKLDPSAAPAAQPRWLLVGIAAVCSIGLLVAGCGSSKSSTASTPAKPALTKATFLAQANAICEEGNQKLAAAQQVLEKTVGAKAPNEAQITAYATAVFIPSIQGQIEKIRALGAPAGEEATLTHMLGVAQADLNQVKSKPSVLVSGRPFASFAKLAHPYGLTACAKNA